MPGINGIEAAEQIRKKDKECSIIFLTAFDEFSYAKKAITVRALDYLLKPYDEQELMLVMDEAMRQADAHEGSRGGNVSDSPGHGEGPQAETGRPKLRSVHGSGQDPAGVGNEENREHETAVPAAEGWKAGRFPQTSGGRPRRRGRSPATCGWTR